MNANKKLQVSFKVIRLLYFNQATHFINLFKVFT